MGYFLCRRVQVVGVQVRHYHEVQIFGRDVQSGKLFDKRFALRHEPLIQQEVTKSQVLNLRPPIVFAVRKVTATTFARDWDFSPSP